MYVFGSREVNEVYEVNNRSTSVIYARFHVAFKHNNAECLSAQSGTHL